MSDLSLAGIASRRRKLQQAYHRGQSGPSGWNVDARLTMARYGCHGIADGRLRHRGEHPEYRRMRPSACRGRAPIDQCMTGIHGLRIRARESRRWHAPCCGGAHRGECARHRSVSDSSNRRSTACRRRPSRSPRPFGFPITNSMVVTWIVAVGLIVFAQLATRRMTAGSGRRPELSRMAGRKPLRPAREHHRPAPGRADVLVLRHHLHLHPRRQLDRPDSRRRHHRLGPSHRRRLRRRATACSGAPTPIST